jgi:hypothetical protein
VKAASIRQPVDNSVGKISPAALLWRRDIVKTYFMGFFILENKYLNASLDTRM